MRCFACGTEKAPSTNPIQYSRIYDEVLCIDCWEEAQELRHPGTTWTGMMAAAKAKA